MNEKVAAHNSAGVRPSSWRGESSSSRMIRRHTRSFFFSLSLSPPLSHWLGALSPAHPLGCTRADRGTEREKV